ncbi:MAG: CoA transferase [Chloroflexi bacterium]|nr:CoA transferase [Chloroflexota bacterium]
MTQAAARLGVLADLLVVDLSQGVAGPYAARILSDFGADVWKIEPPGGDQSRHVGPFAPGGDLSTSGLFEYLNWNKRSAVIDLDTAADRAVLKRLLLAADVCIESETPGRLAALGLDYDTLAGENPGLVMVSVTPFGQNGPRAGWLSDEIVDWAMGGYMYFGGEPSRPPLMIPGYQAQYHTAQAVAIGALAALHYRRRSGLGQHVDQSIQEATLGTHAWNSESWTHEGQVMRRIPSDLVRCKDGYVMCMKRMVEPNVFVLMERFDMIDDPQFADPMVWRDAESPIWRTFREWALGQEMMSVYRRGQELRIAVTPVATMADLLASEQLALRDWFVELDTALGTIKLPGFPYAFQGMAPAVHRTAPALDAHGDELRALAPSRRATTPAVSGGANGAPAGTDAEPPEALAGLHVIEVTANWAGPLAGRHLGDLGAEVIKVEYAQRPATRALWYPGGDPAKYPYNRAGYFNHLNRNKKDVCLDLSSEEGKELFLRLVEWADVLIENNSARVMPNLGLGRDTLLARNPRLIMLSVSGFGATGPERDYVAYGANIEASCGLASVTGYGDDRPFRAGTFYADPIAANYATIATLVALEHREQTGAGQWIDMSLNEGGITFFGGSIAEYQLSGELPPHRANRHPVYAPQGAYQTVGADQWVALTVRNDADWAALCAALGRDDWAKDAALATAAGRRARHDELDAGIAGWAAKHDHREAARLLQAAGVPAGPVLANFELVSDPHLFHRDFYQPIEHAEVGVFRFPGPPWKLSRTPGRIRLAAPLFAEHNDYVFGEVLGLSAAEIVGLEQRGVTARQPITP